MIDCLTIVAVVMMC